MITKGGAMTKEDMYDKMRQAIIEGDKASAESLASQAIQETLNLNEVVEKGFIPGIQEVGNLWEKGEYFLPELITSAECMKAAMQILQPEMQKAGLQSQSLGKVIIGTIEGDIHDIGKNLVASLLSANGFDVIDLGADVSLDNFIEKAQSENADYICVSSLLTTTMLGQKRLIEKLKEKDLYGNFKVMVGGAPVNQQWADDIGADGYAENAMTAVSKAKALL